MTFPKQKRPGFGEHPGARACVPRALKHHSLKHRCLQCFPQTKQLSEATVLGTRAM